ncbi:MAG: c-type cytochrome [Sedimentisphaerales bacterium]
MSQGKSLFSSHGCITCHTIEGKGGKVGPNLSNIGSQGLSMEWLTVQIKDPKKHDPGSIMPSFSSMSDQDINSLTTYLESLKSSSEQSSSQSSNDPNSVSAKSNDPNVNSGSSQTQNASLINDGKSLFSSEGCIGCHTINGNGGSVGPNLSTVGSKGLSKEWLTVQIKDPKKHDPGSVMPSFSSLSDNDVDALTTYLESLKKSPSKQTSSTQSSTQEKEPTTSVQTKTTSPPRTTEPNATSMESMPTGRAAYFVGDPPHGKKLYDKHCNNCHGKDGKGGISNPGSASGEIPALNPISKELFSSNPITFAENIDRYIQHGAKPPGPHPEKAMPAYGDNLKLTQEMIAEIEAYILKLNGVNRAEVLHPGVAPVAFFGMTLIGYGIAVFIILGLGTKLDKNIPNDNNDTGSGTPESGSDYSEEKTLPENEEKQTQSQDISAIETEKLGHLRQKSQESQTTSASFVIVVIIVITIIATSVMLIFRTFVTSKPIPSGINQHISGKQETSSESNSGNTSQSQDNQQRESEE